MVEIVVCHENTQPGKLILLLLDGGRTVSEISSSDFFI